MTGPAEPECSAKRFEELLASVVDAAYGTAFRMTGNRDAAEDLIQEAAILAFGSFHTFELGTNFKAWFFRIMINRFRADYRKRQRAPQTLDFDDAPEFYLYLQTAQSGIQASTADPAHVVIDKMSEESIQAAIDSLPEEFQLVSVLYFMEELSYEEIAEIVGCPLGTVRSRLHRGRKMLQKALWQLAGEQGVVAELVAASS